MPPIKISIVAILAGLSSLVGSASAWAEAGLDGTWRLLSVDSRPVAKGLAGLPYFTVKGQLISGFDGCNQFSGRLDQPVSIAATRMGCAEGAVKLPLDLSKVAAHLDAGKIGKKYLELPGRKPFPASVFVRLESIR